MTKAATKKKAQCKDCWGYLTAYDEDIKCEKHRKPGKGYFPYRVACRKCDAILLSDDKEDSLCAMCAL